MEKIFDKTTYVICHNGKDIIHPSKVEAGANLSSGQPEFEEFDTEEAWKARLTELGYNFPTQKGRSDNLEGTRLGKIEGGVVKSKLKEKAAARHRNKE